MQMFHTLLKNPLTIFIELTMPNKIQIVGHQQNEYNVKPHPTVKSLYHFYLLNLETTLYTYLALCDRHLNF